MKRFLIIIFIILAMTKPVMGSEQTTKLTGKLKTVTLDALVSIYQNPEEVVPPNVADTIEYPENASKESEYTLTLLEQDAYTALLPKLVTQIKDRDAKNYWFKKYDPTNFPWYKIVHKAITNKEQKGPANDFMAYLYDLNIKGLNKKEIQELSKNSGIRIEDGYYTIGGKYENNNWSGGSKFKKTLSFFQKHWGKIATGTALGAAAIAGAALYKNREDIGHRINAYRLGNGAWGTEPEARKGAHGYHPPKRGYFESESSYADRAGDWLEEEYEILSDLGKFDKSDEEIRERSKQRRIKREQKKAHR